MSKEIHFSQEDAIKYGVENAIILYNLKFWIIKNKANGVNFFDNHYWTYNSGSAFAKLFPFWNDQKIRRHLRELEELGVIKSANHNKNKMDKTKWYCVVDESFMSDIEEESSSASCEETIDCSEANKDCLKTNNGVLNNEQAIPYNKPYNKTHILNSEKRFVKPTAEEIRAFCKEIGVSIDADYFIDYYESKGWIVSGKNKMKNWKATIRNWARRNGQKIKTDKQLELPKPEREWNPAPKVNQEEFMKRMEQLKKGFKA